MTSFLRISDIDVVVVVVGETGNSAHAFLAEFQSGKRVCAQDQHSHPRAVASGCPPPDFLWQFIFFITQS